MKAYVSVCVCVWLWVGYECARACVCRDPEIGMFTSSYIQIKQGDQSEEQEEERDVEVNQRTVKKDDCQSSGGCRFNTDYRQVTIQEYLTLVPRVMANGIRTDDPRGFNKGRSSKFHEGS